MSTPIIIVRAVDVLAFVVDPLLAVLGFVMFRYPQAWAKGNARVTHGEHRELDSSKQLAHTKLLGTLFMIFAAFSFLSMLYAKALLARMN